MAEVVVAGKLTLDSSQPTNSVKNFKKELRDANADLLQMQQNFGELSPEAIQAAKNVAMLKDRIQDAREVSDLFDPGKKFAVFGNVLRTVAGGFSALTGAAALFGAESEDLQKTLLKVQAALAITEGVNTIVDATKDFSRLKVVAVDALKGIRAAISSTGIGLIVVALGTIVAYWDDIKELVTGVSGEQKDVLETTTKQADVEKEKLSSIGDQDNILKLQGKTEKEILAIKVKQIDATIAAGDAQIEAQKNIVKAQVETANRNKAILKGILDFVNQPIIMILRGVDALRNALGQTSTLATDLNETISNFFFDPKKTQEDGQKTIDELNKAQTQLKNQRAGFLLSMKDIDKKAADDRKTIETDALKQLKAIREENDINEIADERKRAEEKLKIDEQNALNEIAALKVSAKTKADLIAETEEKFNLARIEQNKEFDKKEADAEKAKTDQAAKDKKDAYDKELEAIKQHQLNIENALKEDVLNGDVLTPEDQAAKELEIKRASLQAQYDLAAKYGYDTSALQGQILDANLAAQKSYADKSMSYDKAVAESKQSFVNNIGAAFGALSQLLGQSTAAGKAAALAEIAIGTGVGFINALKIAQQSAAGTGPLAAFAFPAFYATQLAAVLAAASRAKSILSSGTTASGGGTSIPSGAGVQAPLQNRPTVQNTQLPQNQINQLGNATVRAFVVESDVTGSQERIRRLNRAAVLGK